MPSFEAEIFEWRGPAPYFWVALPEDVCDYVTAQSASYGWGAVPVVVTLGATTWETSLLPRDGGYVLPLRLNVRQREKTGDAGTVSLSLTVATRGGRAASGPR